MSKKNVNVLDSFELQDKINILEEKYHGKDDFLGRNLLTIANKLNSPRAMMFGSHLEQSENILNCEIPRMFTNYENVFGSYASSLQKAKGDLKVITKISKFPDSENMMNVKYILVVYNKTTKVYDIIEKIQHEKLTEHYGYLYQTEFMDDLDEGDEVNKGDILYKSTSFDKYNNYRYGYNALSAYVIDEDTIEDAIKCSESFAKNTVSMDIEEISRSINDNDILLNIYGDYDNYKAFPDIGERIQKQIVCFKRRKTNSTVLFDLKGDNLRIPDFNNDEGLFTQGMIADIDVYCNKPYEDLPDKPYYNQIKKYLRYNLEYYKNIIEVLTPIIESGEEYSNDLARVYQRAKNALDPNVLWSNEKKAFSNIVINFTIYNESNIVVGSKLTGRFGNKGVISEIVPDHEMPKLDDGRTVELLFNQLGIINRLNAGQLYEHIGGFYGDRILRHINTIKSYKEKDKILIKFISIMNKKQGEKLGAYLATMGDKQHEMFYESTNETGILIHNPPFWDTIRFDAMYEVYKEFKDVIKPYETTIWEFGREIKTIYPLIAGEMYIMKLKHHPRGKFIARSSGFINPRGLPAKSLAGKKKEILFSKNPVRIGEQEKQALEGTGNTDEIVRYDMLYRSSVVGRRDMGELYDNDNVFPERIELNPEARNRNAEMLRAVFKTVGLELLDLDDRVHDIDKLNNKFSIKLEDEPKKNKKVKSFKFKLDEEDIEKKPVKRNKKKFTIKMQ